MIKEAVVRSPKWLRKFADFEVITGEDKRDQSKNIEFATGKDVKGITSKKAIEKRSRELWDQRWDQIHYEIKVLLQRKLCK